MSKKVECVRVAMRCRPLSNTEMENQRKICVEITKNLGQIVINNPKNDGMEQFKTFTYDMVYDWNAS